VNGAYFVSAAKLDSLPVPYKSTPPAMTDLIGGRIHWMFVDAAASQGHVKAGRLRAIALMGDHPSETMPDLPPVGATVPGFDTVPWAGMFAPARTPKHIIGRLNAEIVKAIEKPGISQRLIDAGLQPAPSTPAQLDQFVKQQLSAWGKKIKDAGIQPE
jgi:tripartite-type tricarboxylate transporter receptor subunit TctC